MTSFDDGPNEVVYIHLSSPEPSLGLGIENEANYGLQIIVGKKKEKGEELEFQSSESQRESLV